VERKITHNLLISKTHTVEQGRFYGKHCGTKARKSLKLKTQTVPQCFSPSNTVERSPIYEHSPL
jgi:hypothetical protein